MLITANKMFNPDNNIREFTYNFNYHRFTAAAAFVFMEDNAADMTRDVTFNMLEPDKHFHGK